MKLFVRVSFRSGIWIAIWLVLASAADASRVWQPMGAYIRQAALVVLADTRSGTNIGETVLSIREVLKGDARLAGETIVLRGDHLFSSGDAYIPPGVTNIGVLLSENWKEAKQSPVLETCRTPEELTALRTLVPICALENERERLVALRGMLGQQNRTLQQELFAQLRDMRAATNFDILTNLYSATALTNRIELIDIIGKIGDVRGVPTLIAAAESADLKLSRTAVDHLHWNFPGAPGVSAAMRKAVEREHLTRAAAQYLAFFDSDSKFAALAEGPGTPWLRATRLLENGKREEGRAAFLKIAGNEQENIRTRLRAASQLRPDASETEKRQLRRSILPQLARQEYTNDYLLALHAAEALRDLRHPDCLPALLRILEPTPFTFSQAGWTAAMAVRELGESERQKTVEHVIRQLKLPPPKTVFGENPVHYPLELLWLGRQRDFAEAERLMHPDYASSWKLLRPLQTFSAATDESTFLTQQLAQQANLPREAREWLLFRQGELKDKKAIPELIATLTNDPDWKNTQSAADALIAIGGNEVEAKLIKLLSHEDENRVRRHSTEALMQILGDRSRTVALRVLTEKDFGWKPAAYQALGKFGTADDLNLLRPLSDYWIGDRENHYWAMSALTVLRERCRYDINGPISPAR